MQSIDIDFDVFKELTARRAHEGHTYNDVLRELLGLARRKPNPSEAVSCASSQDRERRGFALRGGELPHGTQLRAIYKGEEFRAIIEDGEWLDRNRKSQSSPSAAAKDVTGTNVNGLRFWHAKRPSDREFLRLDILFAKLR
ncbi:DUF4357 domain-containing protein [Hephaestia sp. GCM10023244]|uniref:DUF4357 domain-containing protein n=1 Tax=unclassified Hephaestia TaxID=2631281 RepID=UPI00207731D9|nr:DUF4357 domain-containing protein [Hephaestia sp. MAHUQ-44]MCM8731774.1 DUF4357 domain-containing protein [Hephaestia sp. MAHUQ-44]